MLCLGEIQIELVCRRPAEAFVPQVGGTAARVAMAAAGLGASVAVAGDAGDDEWGRWLRVRLSAAGVDVSRFGLRPGVQTPLALVSVSPEGQADWTRYGGAPAEPNGDWLRGAR